MNGLLKSGAGYINSDRVAVLRHSDKDIAKFSSLEWISLVVLLLGIAYVSPAIRLNPSLLSVCNYSAVSMAGLATILSMRLSNNRVMLFMAIMGASSLLFSVYFDLYMTAIFLSNILIVNISALSFRNQKFSNTALRVLNSTSLLIVLVELLILYVSAIQNPPTSPNGFLASGLDYGFTKGTMPVFLFLAIFYLAGSKRRIYLWLFVLLAAPALISMRMSTSAFIALLAALVVKRLVIYKKKFPTAFVLLLPWILLLSLVAVLLSINKFDRLPTYMIALYNMYHNPFGLGANQYSNYILSNYQTNFSEFSEYISDGFNVIWNSAEAMFGELLASFGVLGILLIAEYIRLNNALITRLSALMQEEKPLAYTFAIMIFSGIAHDYSKMDFFYYYLVGAVIGIVQRTTRACPNSRQLVTR